MSVPFRWEFETNSDENVKQIICFKLKILNHFQTFWLSEDSHFNFFNLIIFSAPEKVDQYPRVNVQMSSSKESKWQEFYNIIIHLLTSDPAVPDVWSCIIDGILLYCIVMIQYLMAEPLGRVMLRLNLFLWHLPDDTTESMYTRTQLEVATVNRLHVPFETCKLNCSGTDVLPWRDEG